MTLAKNLKIRLMVVTSFALVGCELAQNNLAITKAPSTASATVTKINPIAAKPGDFVQVSGDNFSEAKQLKVKFALSNSQISDVPLAIVDRQNASFVMPEGVGLGLRDVKLIEGTGNEVASFSLVANQTSNTLPIFIGEASDICSDKQYIDRNGDTQTGTKNCAGTTPSSAIATQATVATGSENDDAVTTVTLTPGSNSVFSSVVVNLGAQFQKSNICAGKTIFGRLGTAYCSLTFGSRGHRDPGNTTERNIPSVATDDDGMDGSVTRPDTSGISSCGSTQATIEARIASCNLTWDGGVLGKTGEGKWSLVTKLNGKEVWRDERTGMLWSDDLGDFNWCQASGNTENTEYGDCSAGAESGLQPAVPVSVCSEGAGLNSDGYDDQKGNMRKAVSANAPSVTWRLPSRMDYFQGYSNGMGYVLPSFEGNFWTATVVAIYRGWAFRFWAYTAGTAGLSLSNNPRDLLSKVRCVGR